MCRVTEQKQNNNFLMIQFDCGLVLIAHSEYVFIISTVLHEYGCPHSAALIFCNNFPRMLISVFFLFVFPVLELQIKAVLGRRFTSSSRTH